MSKHTNKVIDHLLNNPQFQFRISSKQSMHVPMTSWKQFVDKIKTVRR